MRVGLFGTGRLGQVIASEAGPALAWQVSRQAPPEAPVDAAIECTVGAVVAERVAWAVERRVPLVIGTTGWELPDLARRVEGTIPVVVAPNFSLGVALMARLATVIGRFAQQDPARDPWLLDHHHAKKRDAPSGTAKLLARAVMTGCPRKTSWSIVGDGVHDPATLSVSVVRAGAQVGLHTVGVDAPGETLTVTHEARSRAPFAQGALAAARWALGKPPGLYAMDDVARDLLDPLFRSFDR